MKKCILIVICLVCAVFFNPAANGSELASGRSQSAVDLQGTLIKSGPTRNPVPPVEAYQTDTTIELVFNIDLGVLNIVVTDQSGAVVFQTKVNATVGSTLIIDASNWEEGSYSITICNESNECAEGEFMIES